MGLSSVGLCRHALTAHEVVDDGIDGAIEVEEPVGDTHGRLLQLATELILLPPVLSQSRPETQSGPRTSPSAALKHSPVREPHPEPP